MSTNYEAIANGERSAYPDEYGHGMTKRELFSAMAMQALLSNPKLQKEILDNGYSWIEESAIKFADCLLVRLTEFKP